MKKILICLFTLLFFVPINVFGLSSDYDDVTSSVVGVKKEEDKINLYLFYSYSCPHCHEEIKYLESDFQEFIHKDEVYLETAEVFLPDTAKKNIVNGNLKLRNIISEGVWAGLTYKEDLEELKNKINNLIEAGEYPTNLWNN